MIRDKISQGTTGKEKSEMHYMFMLIQRFIWVHTSSSSNSAYLDADLCSILVATEATRSASGLLVTSSPLGLGLMG